MLFVLMRSLDPEISPLGNDRCCIERGIVEWYGLDRQVTVIECYKSNREGVFDKCAGLAVENIIIESHILDMPVTGEGGDEITGFAKYPQEFLLVCRKPGRSDVDWFRQ